MSMNSSLPGAGTRPLPRHLRLLAGQPEADPIGATRRDEELAHHGIELRKLVDGHPVPDAWTAHLLPLLDQLYARAGREVLQATGEARLLAIGYQQGLEDFVEVVAGTIQLGRKAVSQIHARRMAQVAAAERREAGV
jgi:hypothetical protein